MSVMMYIFAALLACLGLNLIHWQWGKCGAKTKEKDLRKGMKNVVSESKKSGTNGQMDEWCPHTESVTTGSQKSTQSKVSNIKFIRPIILYSGCYKNSEVNPSSFTDVWAFVGLHTSGRLVAPGKYRWVVRIQYNWNNREPSGGKKLQTTRVQIKPDMIADPLTARVWVERMMKRKGYRKFFPKDVYTNEPTIGATCRELVAKLGLEPIDSWPEAKNLDELITAAD